jgi:hypothetical protein
MMTTPLGDVLPVGGPGHGSRSRPPPPLVDVQRLPSPGLGRGMSQHHVAELLRPRARQIAADLPAADESDLSCCP